MTALLFKLVGGIKPDEAAVLFFLVRASRRKTGPARLTAFYLPQCGEFGTLTRIGDRVASAKPQAMACEVLRKVIAQAALQRDTTHSSYCARH